MTADEISLVLKLRIAEILDIQKYNDAKIVDYRKN
jgi:hypothetical protein